MSSNFYKANRSRVPWLGIAVLTMMWIGCAHQDHRSVKTACDDGSGASSQSRSVLAAMKAGRVDMFGEVSEGFVGDYFTRSAVSLRQHTFIEEGGDFDPDVSPDGKHMVFSSTRHTMNPDLYVKAVDGVAVTQLTSDASSDVQPAFDPSGRLVAFASDRGGSWDIWIVAVDGSRPIQVTNGPGEELHPSWSNDGQRLVYCSLPPDEGQWELWIADAMAGGSKTFIGYGLFPDWSPQNDTILYQRARVRGTRWFSLWTLELIDGQPGYPTEVASSSAHAMILPSWSQDGEWIAYTTVAPDPAGFIERPRLGDVSDIWMMRADGRSRTRLTDSYSGNYGATFDNLGRVYFTSARAGHENVWSLVPSKAVPYIPESGRITGTPDRQHMASTVIEPTTSQEGE
jgi:TolB protein